MLVWSQHRVCVCFHRIAFRFCHNSSPNWSHMPMHRGLSCYAVCSVTGSLRESTHTRSVSRRTIFTAGGRSSAMALDHIEAAVLAGSLLSLVASLFSLCTRSSNHKRRVVLTSTAVSYRHSHSLTVVPLLHQSTHPHAAHSGTNGLGTLVWFAAPNNVALQTFTRHGRRTCRIRQTCWCTGAGWRSSLQRCSSSSCWHGP